MTYDLSVALQYERIAHRLTALKHGTDGSAEAVTNAARAIHKTDPDLQRIDWQYLCAAIDAYCAEPSPMMPKDRGKSHRRQAAEHLIAAFGIAALLGALGWFVR